MKAMGSKERRERERDLVRTRIMDAARELFAAEGYEGVSMRAIAAKIEYSPTVIYQYFRDKEALIHELCYADFRKLVQELAGTQRITDPLDRLLACGMAYALFGVAYPNHYRLMFMMNHYAVEPDEPEMAAIKGNPESDAYALLLDQIQSAAAAGLLRDPNADPELVAQTMWAGIHGVVSLHISLACNHWTAWRPFEQRVRTMLTALATGLFKEAD